MPTQMQNAGSNSHERVAPSNRRMRRPGEPLSDAMERLRQTLSGDGGEETARAYQALRRAGNGMNVGELVAAVRAALGPEGLTTVIDAHAHLACYMCTAGVVVCHQCQGRGEIEQGRSCAHCDGLGVIRCGFCGGTGWADRASHPAELREAIVLQQAAHVRKTVGKLVEVLGSLTRAKARALPARQRVQLVARLLHTQARLADLAEADAVDPKTRGLMHRAAEKLDPPLELLRGGMRPDERHEEDDEATDAEAPSS
ncbi:MAG: hypothetical protein KGY99_03590 [Phycisphaerae bacterium]|nr:hypothetical protein [Phycisphaerae bacterium]